MAKLEELGEVISSDVLIIGGGIGGLTMAVKLKEENPNIDVLIVEKQTVGWAGKAPKIGGLIAFLGPQDNGDKFMDFQVRNTGCYLNDQELFSKYIQQSYKAVEDFDAWGVRMAKTPDGKLASQHAFWAPDWSMTFIDIDMMLPIRAKARKMKTRIMNKIHIVDLLKEGNRVVGAVGFNIIDGRFYIFRSKATVLANGSCGYKVRRFWMAGAGDGIAAAYRAGAEMRNAEFGNLYAHTVYQNTDSGMVGYEFLVNASGENLAKKYMGNVKPEGVFLPRPMAIGLEKEVSEGRGPIYFAPRTEEDAYPHGLAGGLPKIADWTQRMGDKEKKYGGSGGWTNKAGGKNEIGVPFHGEASCIKVDHDMKTNLEGLWAIGDASYAGSAVAGAVACPPGITPASGIMYAVIAPRFASPSIARYVSSAALAEVSYTEAKDFKKNTFVFMQREKGLSTDDAVAVLQDVTAPIKYNLRRSQGRIEEALTRLGELKEKLPTLWAKDLHYLSKCHEVKSMTLCAELTFRAAMMRTETRGFHYREDYPQRDDKNWLKWIIIKDKAGKMTLSTEPIPIGKYKVKP
jgi:succinate dehydrogenase / fumarate reductase, flavoprotein subunit